MAPIRVGIVGLSSKPGAWATLAHLPRLAASPNFEIVALMNSSLASTEAAIKAHNLPATTKAYDSPEKLAQDPDVDLFVVSTRVDTHYNLAKPALQAGKNIYVEWPLCATTQDAEELVALAKEKNVRTIVGFQGRVSPSILKVREIIESGKLGNIHSVNIQATTGVWQNNAAGARYHYFMDRKVGGNLLTIYGGHIIDTALSVFGELKPGAYTPMLANLRPRMKIQQDDGSLTEETFEKDTPDQILLQGRIERSPPAVFSLHLRAGTKFKDTPGSTWKIYGDKGELQVSFASAGPQIGAMSEMKFNDLMGGEVEHIKVEEDKEWTDLPVQGQNIGRLYEAYADGKGYADFEVALRRHRLIDEFYAGGM
jgi:predicted dehydrogenase